MALRPTTGYEANVRQPSQQLVTVGVLLGTLGIVLTLIGCSSGSESGPNSQGSEFGTYAYAALGEGPEPSPDLALIDTLHFHLAGAQLVLSYDPATNAFTGTVENTTENTLPKLSVAVYLDSHETLLETPVVDLAPSQVIEVTLPVGSKLFTSWSARLVVH